MGVRDSGNITTTVNVFVDQVNQSAGTLGIAPLSPSDTVSDAFKKLQSNMYAQVNTVWKQYYPSVLLPPGHYAFGVMGPLDKLTTSPPPQCVIDEVTRNIKGWVIALTTDVATQIAETIAQQVISTAGSAAWSVGNVPTDANFQIDFLIGYSSLPVTQTEMGVFYTFAAQTAFRDGGDIGVPPGGFGDHP